MIKRYSKKWVVRKAPQVLAVLIALMSVPAFASPFDQVRPLRMGGDGSLDYVESPNSQLVTEELRQQLIHEKYRTAILQERARQRRFLEDEERRRQDEQMRDTSLQGFADQSQHRKDSNDLDLFNEVVNTLGNIAAQASLISNLGRRAGW